MSGILRGFGLTFLYLFVATSAGSVLAWLLNDVLSYEYYKVLSRSVLLFAAIGLVPLWRMAGFSAANIGLLPTQPRHVLAAFPVGLAIVLPVMMFFIVVQYRLWDERVDFGDWEIYRFFCIALVSGLLVGIFEEVLFRGVLFGALRRSASFGLSTVVASVLYAGVHFLDGEGGVTDHVAWYTGYQIVLAAFSPLLQPSEFWDGFAALFLLGVLFCWVREKIGLWWCIGLHAALVFAIRVFKELTVRDGMSPYLGWVSNYDNFVGNLVSVWLIFLFVVVALYRQVKAR